ncbi:MAG TPA: O-antigen ligase family protein [Bacteroidota bacterium]|nr:O-antigen ligase family protein [Bacteroidota bacterium]
MISILYERAITGAQGVRSRTGRYDIAALTAGSVIIAMIYVVSGGSVFTAVSLLGAVAVVVLTLYRVDWGFMFFVGCVLLFDQFPPGGYERSIIGIEYFQNLKSLKVLQNVGPAVANPLELHLFFVILAWVLLIITGKKVVLSRVPGWAPATLFFSWLAAGAVLGIGRGGDFLPALWEIRALFYLGIMFFFVPQIIQTKDQVRQLFWVIIAALSFKTIQGVVRVVNLGFSFGRRDELTSHEDPLFFVTLVVLLAGLYLYRARNSQRLFLTWLFPPMIAVFFLAQRRATWAALGASVAAFLALIESRPRRNFLKMLVPVLLVAAVYLGIFWDSPSGGIGHGAFLVRSSLGTTREEAGERYYSNLYRDFENYNLAQTVKSSPTAGIGFGNKYLQPIKLPKIPFTLAEYIPHNEIFWMMVKVGVIGFFLLWLFFYSHVMRASSLFARLKDPYLKAVCAVTVIAVLGQVVVSFYDLQLTFYRNMVYLGALMGLSPALERLQRQEDAEAVASN